VAEEGIKVAQLNVLHELQLRISLTIPKHQYSQLSPGWVKVTFVDHLPPLALKSAYA